MRKGLSRPMKILHKLNLLQGSTLDFGCGKHEDCDILKSAYNYRIKGYDKFNPIHNDESLLIDYYDTITCNYVFNVIPDLIEHQELIAKLKSLSGNIYISVRSDKKAIQPTWTYHDNSLGYWTSRQSFQRFYNKELINKLFGKVEYIYSNSAVILFKL